MNFDNKYMKQLNNKSTRGIFTAAIFTLLIIFGATTARAQLTILQPFMDCYERERDSSGAFTDNNIIYYGYTNTTTTTYTLPYRTANNFFSPNIDVQNPPTVFSPGTHRRVVAVTLPVGLGMSWFLGTSFVVANFSIGGLCSDNNGANARLITYQGKLSDGGAAANGTYDLQFQLFNAATGGEARTTQIKLEDVPVTNGIFTVQLDLGANVLRSGDSGINPNLKLNPAILDAENSFFEIGVRAGTSTGAFTTLTPRQPLTAVPLAMRAESATVSYRAANADSAERFGGLTADKYLTTANASSNYIQSTTTQQTNSNFNISGSGTIGGTLTANATNINGTLTANTTNISGTLTANKSVANGFLARGGAPGAYGANNNGYGFKSDSGDDDGGLFSNGNGQVSLYTNSGERVRITDSGLQVFGTLTANTKNFKIDHPLDPLNKTLTYTSIESPDMMNIYNGNITTDGRGEAVVEMPNYFEALNKDFRYQLTVIGTFAQAIVLEKISGNQFKIKTDKPNVEVSWQVTGIRHDKFAEDKQTQVEQNKSAADKGKCLYAPACGQQ